MAWALLTRTEVLPSTTPQEETLVRFRVDAESVVAFRSRYDQNVTQGGLSLVGGPQVEPGSEVRFVVELKNGSTAMGGKALVRWCVPLEDEPNRWRIGLKFVDLDLSSRQVIGLFLVAGGPGVRSPEPPAPEELRLLLGSWGEATTSPATPGALPAIAPAIEPALTAKPRSLPRIAPMVGLDPSEQKPSHPDPLPRIAPVIALDSSETAAPEPLPRIAPLAPPASRPASPAAPSSGPKGLKRRKPIAEGAATGAVEKPSIRTGKKIPAFSPTPAESPEKAPADPAPAPAPKLPEPARPAERSGPRVVDSAEAFAAALKAGTFELPPITLASSGVADRIPPVVASKEETAVVEDFPLGDIEPVEVSATEKVELIAVEKLEPPPELVPPPTRPEPARPASAPPEKPVPAVAPVLAPVAPVVPPAARKEPEPPAPVSAPVAPSAAAKPSEPERRTPAWERTPEPPRDSPSARPPSPEAAPVQAAPARAVALASPPAALEPPAPAFTPAAPAPSAAAPVGSRPTADALKGSRHDSGALPAASRTTAGAEADGATRLGRALEALHRGDFEIAEAELQQAIAVEPRSARLRLELGLLYARWDGGEGHDSAAEASFARAIELDPKAASAHVQLGEIQLRRRLAGEARRSFERALEIDPNLRAAKRGIERARALGWRKRAPLFGGVGAVIALALIAAGWLRTVPPKVVTVTQQIPAPHQWMQEPDRQFLSSVSCNPAQAAVAATPPPAKPAAAAAAPVAAGPAPVVASRDASADSKSSDQEKHHSSRGRRSEHRSHASHSGGGGGGAELAKLVKDGDAALRAGRVDDALAAYNKALAKNPKYAPAHRGLGSVYVMQGRDADAKAAYQKYLALAPHAPDAPRIQALLSDM